MNGEKNTGRLRLEPARGAALLSLLPVESSATYTTDRLTRLLLPEICLTGNTIWWRKSKKKTLWFLNGWLRNLVKVLNEWMKRNSLIWQACVVLLISVNPGWTVPYAYTRIYKKCTNMCIILCTWVLKYLTTHLVNYNIQL